MKDWYQSQKGYFAGKLREEMKKNPKIYLILADLGFGMFDKIKEEYPDRCINVGASEEAMVGIAVGLALEGKIPFCYTITSFYLRAAETISLYLDHEQIPVKLIGSGRDDDYKTDGYTHYAYKTQEFLNSLMLQNIYPDTKKSIPNFTDMMIKNGKPSFISLSRKL